MRSRRPYAHALIVSGLIGLLGVPASAHHEAMFGPQSSAVLTPGIFLSALGISEERTFASEVGGVPLAESGASGIFMHPGIVFSTTPAVQFFALVSLPLTQQWNSVVDRQRFRLGAGVIWILKHSGT